MNGYTLERVFNRLLYSNCVIKLAYDSNKHLLYYSCFFTLNVDYLQTSVLFTFNQLFEWDRIWIQYNEWMSKEIKCENTEFHWNSILDHSSCIINRIRIRLRILPFHHFDCLNIAVSKPEYCQLGLLKEAIDLSNGTTKEYRINFLNNHNSARTHRKQKHVS